MPSGAYFRHPTKEDYWVYFRVDEVLASHRENNPVPLDWDKPDRHSSPTNGVRAAKVRRPERPIKIIRIVKGPSSERTNRLRTDVRAGNERGPGCEGPRGRLKLVRAKV